MMAMVKSKSKNCPRSEPALKPRQRMRKVVAALARAYPDAGCALEVRSPLEVLIATILSAQCTDKKVNQVLPQLFRRYPDIPAFAKARQSSLETIIRPIGLYHAKARNIIAAAKRMNQDFADKVPCELDDLVTLPGVGRKTANCVLVNAFGKPGIMCDTHCCRVSGRLGLHNETDPVKIEFILADLMPPRQWGAFSHRIIIHGRQVCKSRKPGCNLCSLGQWCAYKTRIARKEKKSDKP